MKCHYEVLDVSRDADDSEIKTAYRKLALKWHPDKNLDNPEYAKEQFQVVQQAYEVLSDRQERAWYDKHREQIVRGCNSEFQDKSLDVFQYFTTMCFKGYGDDANGFYSVYRKVFEDIAKEDMEFIEEKDEFCEIPNFGNSQTDYEKVSQFYTCWMNYTTKKSYVWLDPYDITETKDRRYVKLLEKENKKVRQKARKERNEEIRNLVAFIRKRDKRVHAQKKIQEQKLVEDKKKRELLSKQKRLERQQQLNESGTQPEWAKFDNVKSELEEIERSLVEQFGEEFSNSEGEDQNEDFNNFYCVACNKVFKTPKAFENHEFSKKHKENVEILKESMLNADSFEEHSVSDDLEDYNDLGGSHNDEKEFLNDSSVQSDSGSIEEITKNKQKKKKKARNILSTENQDAHHAADEEDVISKPQHDDNFDFGLSKKPKKKNKKNTSKAKTEQASNNSEEKSDTESTSKLKDNNIAKTKKDKKVRKDIETDVIDIDHNCVTCKSSFPSKNKLFDHLKKTGHGVYVPSNVKNKNKKKTIREK